MTNSKSVTFKRIQTGYFLASVDGVETNWVIINGSAGLSGHGRNMYGIFNREKGGEAKWLGTLATCKKTITRTLTRGAETNAALGSPLVTEEAAPAAPPVGVLRSELTGRRMEDNEHEFNSTNRIFEVGEKYEGSASGTVYRVLAVSGNNFREGRGQIVLAEDLGAVCGLCGAYYGEHFTSPGNRPPTCVGKNSRPGDTFVRKGGR